MRTRLTSRSGSWRLVSGCDREDAELAETIREIHKRSRGTYGSLRIWAELRLGAGIRVSPQTGRAADAPSRYTGRCPP